MAEEIVNEYGLAHLKGEGNPIHPDDVDASMTPEQRAKQLTAYNDAYSIKNFDTLWRWISARGSVITVQECSELEHVFNLMRECDCQSYLEVGTAEGNSLYVLGHAVRGNIYYIDLGEKHTETPRIEVCKILNSERNRTVGFFIDSTHPDILIRDQKYDCILIDGGHDFATVLSDSILYAPLATKYVFWHDIQLPEVRKAVEWFEKRYSHLGEFSSFINSDNFGYRILKVKQ